MAERLNMHCATKKGILELPTRGPTLNGLRLR